MRFNSAVFFFFFLVLVVGLLLCPRSKKLFFFTLMSYVFYGCRHPSFAALLFVSTCADYYLGNRIFLSQNETRRRVFLALSLAFNLSLLAWFKYSGMAVETLNLFRSALSNYQPLALPQILLPAGLSFYTFQSMSYSLDLYWRKCEPAKSFLEFAFFVSFFPQLVAGPIIRAKEFLSQIPNHKEFQWENTVVGCELMIIGFFKKMVIADNLEPVVDHLFSHVLGIHSVFLWMGAIIFSCQLYCDFSGYTDIARGLALLFGFKLPENFSWPYFSSSITEFWRRWHMSLGAWIKAYVYNPMALAAVRAGRKNSLWFVSFFTMLLFGLWHGGAFKFLVFGAYFGVLIAISNALSTTAWGRQWSQSVPVFFRTAATYLMVLFGWILFRSHSVSSGFQYLRALFSQLDGSVATINVIPAFAMVCVLGGVHVLTYRLNYRPEMGSILMRLGYAPRVMVLTVASLFIVVFSGATANFIYFAF